jgi:hypothetical protein
MNAADIPVLGWLLRLGPRDRVLNILLICGPLLFALISITGRNPITIMLAALYILAFIVHVGYRRTSGRG